MDKTQVKIFNKTSASTFFSNAILLDLIERSILKFNLTSNIEIEIIFVNKKEIKKLNKRFRDINSTTDVLSFPQKLLASNKINILGSIVVCPEIVKEKDENINDVILHGLLHLIGYDHEKNEEEWDKAAQKIGCRL